MSKRLKVKKLAITTGLGLFSVSDRGMRVKSLVVNGFVAEAMVKVMFSRRWVSLCWY